MRVKELSLQTLNLLYKSRTHNSYTDTRIKLLSASKFTFQLLAILLLLLLLSVHEEWMVSVPIIRGGSTPVHLLEVWTKNGLRKSGNKFTSFKMAAVSQLLGRRTARYLSPTVRAFCSKVRTKTKKKLTV